MEYGHYCTPAGESLTQLGRNSPYTRGVTKNYRKPQLVLHDGMNELGWSSATMTHPPQISLTEVEKTTQGSQLQRARRCQERCGVCQRTYTEK